MPRRTTWCAAAAGQNPLMPTPAALPPLPFGESIAVAFEDLRSCIDWLGRMEVGPARLGSLGPVEQFRIRFMAVELPGVGLFAGASTPLAIEHLSQRIGIVVPFADCTTDAVVGGKQFRWSSRKACFVNPAGQRGTADSTGGSYLRIDIAPETLELKAQQMLAPLRRKSVDLQLDRPRVVPLQAGSHDWFASIQAVCGIIDAHGCDPAALVALGIDDVICRLAVTLLAPELVLHAQPTVSEPRGFDISPLIETTLGRLHERITLADMARWCERSPRAVQLAFMKKFGTPPMDWLRDQRLTRLRARLLGAAANESLKAAAAACGISRLSLVTADYQRLFGETPEATLTRGRGLLP